MNPSTVIALIAVTLTVVGIIVSMIVGRKKGKSSCSCGCGGCAFADSCHKNKKKDK